MIFQKTITEIEKEIEKQNGILNLVRGEANYQVRRAIQILSAIFTKSVELSKQVEDILDLWHKDNNSCADGVKFPDGTETPEYFIYDDIDFRELKTQLEKI